MGGGAIFDGLPGVGCLTLPRSLGDPPLNQKKVHFVSIWDNPIFERVVNSIIKLSTNGVSAMKLTESWSQRRGSSWQPDDQHEPRIPTLDIFLHTIDALARLLFAAQTSVYSPLKGISSRLIQATLFVTLRTLIAE